MISNEFRFLWFDPGGTTGWSYIALERAAFSRPDHKWTEWIKWWDCGELHGTEHDQLGQAVALIAGAVDDVGYMSVDIGSEDFDLVQTIGGKQNLLSPVRINSVLDWECRKRGVRLQLQNRALRTHVTPIRLVRWGFEGPWRTKGAGKDAFAAMQHGVERIRLIKKQANARPWKLSEGDRLSVYFDCACSYKKGARCDLRHAL